MTPRSVPQRSVAQPSQASRDCRARPHSSLPGTHPKVGLCHLSTTWWRILRTTPWTSDGRASLSVLRRTWYRGRRRLLRLNGAWSEQNTLAARQSRPCRLVWLPNPERRTTCVGRHLWQSCQRDKRPSTLTEMTVLTTSTERKEKNPSQAQASPTPS
jgi:hypothetical protein